MHKKNKMTKKNTSKGKDVYKYDKIYNKKGKLTKKGHGEKNWEEADGAFKSKWEKYGHSNEGKGYINNILKIKPESVLDIGCGHNEMVRDLRSHGLTATGVDCSCPSADVIASAHDLPFDDNSFDLIISFDCMEHVPEEEVEKCFSEFARTGKRMFLKIALTDTPTKIDGEGLHSCIKSSEWWINVAKKYFILSKTNVGKLGTPWEHLILEGVSE
jgi:ubiquinone/menaquinone biosynthesis C-methylase UbiE